VVYFSLIGLKISYTSLFWCLSNVNVVGMNLKRKEKLVTSFGLVSIQVKFGDTLRRFSAPLDPLNGGLDLDMAGLRAKILGLFNFPPDTDFTLTYVDEDGDVVTLVDDEYMRDMMRQSLKFLRIDVQLSNDKGGKTYDGSSGSSTPLRSPQVQRTFPIKTGSVKVIKSLPQALREQLSPEVQHPFPNIKAGGVEVLPVPQLLREPLSKLCLDMASKAASSPVPAELLDFFLKIGQSYLNVDSHTHAGAESSCTQDVAGGSNDTKDGVVEEVMPKSVSVDSASKNSCDVNTGNVTMGVGAPVTPLPASVDLNLPPSDSNPSGVRIVKSAPVASNVPAGDHWKVTKHSHGLKSFGCDVLASSSDPTRPSQTTNTSGNIPMSLCPFAGLPMVHASAMPFANHPFKRSHSHTASMGGMFHKGIQCDGCGVHPIIGPRFKSKV